jgi:hypothetical protein
VAAQVLNELLPEKTIEQQMQWLQNNRNQSRQVPYRIPFVRMAGGVFYRREELAKFAEWEKSRQLGTFKLTGRAAEALRAFGIGEQGGGTQGRLWSNANVTLQSASDGSGAFIQLMINEPLMVFKLSSEQAEELSGDLAEHALAAKRINRNTPKQMDVRKYETVIDNQSVRVIRKKKPK